MPDHSVDHSLIHEWFRRVWNEGDIDAVKALMHPQNLSLGLVNDPVSQESFRAVFDALNNMARDIHVEVGDVFQDEDRIAGNWVMRLTHRATGKIIDFPGALVGRIRDGKFLECTNYADYLNFCIQTGALPDDTMERCMNEKRSGLYLTSLGRGTFADLKRLWSDDPRHFTALFETNSAAMLLVDEEDKIVVSNRSFTTKYGENRSTATPSCFRELVHPADRFEETRLFRGLASNERDEYHTELRLRSGNAVTWVQVSTHGPVRTPDGLRYLRAIHDITTQRLEQMVRFQEQERKLLATDIHDSLAQNMAALNMKLQTASALISQDSRSVEAVLDEAVAISQSLTRELTNMMGHLRSPVFEGVNLVEAIERLVEDSYLNDGRITFVHKVEEELGNSLVSLFAYRIVQEALQNALRHGKADRIEVVLSLQNDRLKGRVTDNGAGFDTSDCAKGSGISGMTERCDLLGGRFELETEKGRGVRIAFELPVSRADGAQRPSAPPGLRRDLKAHKTRL